MTERILLSESHQAKPIKPEDIKHFIYYFMSKDYMNNNERVEFLTKFISKIIYLSLITFINLYNNINNLIILVKKSILFLLIYIGYTNIIFQLYVLN